MSIQEPHSSDEITAPKVEQPKSPLARLALALPGWQPLAKRIGGGIAALAAVGALLSGLTGYWSAWKTVRSDIFHNSQAVQREAVSKPDIAPRLSLVVMPLTNLNRDPEQDYFADGVTTDLTTDLAQIPGTFVIGRGTAFTYKNKPIDAKALGGELRVRWAVQGSVQRTGEQVRINVALIDLSTGGDVWSDRFDGDRVNLAIIQDQITSRLAHELNIELMNAESWRSAAERANNSDAMDFVMRGYAKRYEPATKATTAQSRAYFDDALKFDPTNVDALIGKAWCLATEALNGWSEARTDDLGAAMKLIDAALATRPKSALARVVKAQILRNTGQSDQALREYDAALEIDPNYAQAHSSKGYALILVARAKEAIPEVRIALRLSPKDPLGYVWHSYLCRAFFQLQDVDAAVPECRRSMDLNPTYFWGLATLLSIYGSTGRVGEARLALAEMDRIRPDFSVQFYKRTILPLSTNDQYRRQLDVFLDGLRKAGVREQ
ncbi:tetratricopeptide repeat protein [Bradyrhizobium jicamae]|uniref:tetratricopeptide repeat protein n=1 Tax=Bradyrhizobium jicamae TaxID=280332 RepID=UPI0028967B1E|nr:tetratricopeptide repeat protein [Bradyrhizobium jicamae]